MTTDTKTGEMFGDDDSNPNEPPHMVARINAIAAKIVFPFIAQKDVRIYLCGLNIRPLQPDGGVMITASDGARLIVVRDPDGWVDRELIVAVSKDGLKHALADGEFVVMSNGSAWFQDDIAQPLFIQPGNSVIDGQYPRFEGVLHLRAGYLEGIYGTVNADYLRDALAVDTGGSVPTIRFWTGLDESSPLLFKVDQVSGLEAVGAIMKMREERSDLPTWIPIADSFELLRERAPEEKARRSAAVDKPLNTAGKGETPDPTATTTTNTDAPVAKPQAKPADGKWPFPKKEGAAADTEMEVG